MIVLGRHLPAFPSRTNVEVAYIDDSIPVLSSSMFEEAFGGLNRRKGTTSRVDQRLE